MQTLDITDTLDLYNGYTCDYRRKGSSRYRDFSPFNPYEIKDIQSYMEDFHWQGDRDGLYSAVSAYMGYLGITPETEENISALREERTVAVTTGHQPALCGGPLYVLLKIASVISLCTRLNGLDTDRHYVPVFWAATEDHNFTEYNSVSYYDRANDLVTCTSPGDPGRISASFRPAVSAQTLNEIFSGLPQTEFLPQIISEIESSNTGSMGESFCRLINKWFGRFGLIIVTPDCFRELAVPIIEQAITSHERLVENMNADTADVRSSGYKPQLPDAVMDMTFLFYLQDGCRYRIRYDQGVFAVEELALRLSREEILQRLRCSPESFSPVAGLRPIIQGHVLPVGLYVAGGGELAYHLQLRRNFREFGVDMPLLLPRMAGTFLTPSIKRLLQKFSINEREILTGVVDWERVQRDIMQADGELKSVFSDFEESFSTAAELLIERLQKMGVNGYKDARKELDRFSERFSNQSGRLLQINSPLGDDARNKFFRMNKYLFPAQKYQELSIAGIYFYSLLGAEFFVTICETDVLANDHKLWIFD